METALWSSLFLIIIVGIAIWISYYVIRSAVRGGIVDAYREMGYTPTPTDPKENALQAQREALQEERVRAIVADEQRKQATQHNQAR